MLPTFPLPPLYALTLAIVIAMPGIVAAVIVYRAMRAQLAARQHAEQVAAALGRSNRDLEDFAYAASHDLRAPLRSIANLTDWIEEDLGERITDAARSHLQRMRGRLQRLETMVDDLLCFARAGRDLRDVDFELGDVAARAARELGDLAPATIRVAPDLPRRHGDPDPQARRGRGRLGLGHVAPRRGRGVPLHLAH
jgi:light-regulated signal transduction histidine kinase (bacteriophytochrome)